MAFIGLFISRLVFLPGLGTFSLLVNSSTLDQASESEAPMLYLTCPTWSFQLRASSQPLARSLPLLVFGAPAPKTEG